MQLLLLEGIPGSPDIGRMIPGLVRGDGGAAASGLNLRQSMVACAATAATLHTSVAALGPVRSLEDDLAQLSAELRMVKRISPDLGARLEEGMASLLQAALRTRAGPLSLAHGDFTYTQALFHGRDVGIVDLDNVCRGEPALDLGQFVAYLRVAVRKASLAASRPHEALSNELCDIFLSSYRDSAHLQDTDGLADRVRVYERLSLLRMVVRSWQQLKPARAANALAVLQERSHS
jgi:aminoglycoside phosphotransferase (APT) family kinase protein